MTRAVLLLLLAASSSATLEDSALAQTTHLLHLEEDTNLISVETDKEQIVTDTDDEQVQAVVQDDDDRREPRPAVRPDVRPTRPDNRPNVGPNVGPDGVPPRGRGQRGRGGRYEGPSNFASKGRGQRRAPGRPQRKMRPWKLAAKNAKPGARALVKTLFGKQDGGVEIGKAVKELFHGGEGQGNGPRPRPRNGGQDLLKKLQRPAFFGGLSSKKNKARYALLKAAAKEGTKSKGSNRVRTGYSAWHRAQFIHRKRQYQKKMDEKDQAKADARREMMLAKSKEMKSANAVAAKEAVAAKKAVPAKKDDHANAEVAANGEIAIE